MPRRGGVALDSSRLWFRRGSVKGKTMYIGGGLVVLILIIIILILIF